MIHNIDYIKEFGDPLHNAEVAEIWADLEKIIQEKKIQARNIIVNLSLKPSRFGMCMSGCHRPWHIGGKLSR